MFDGGLFEIFQHEFGLPGARRFEAARQNFVESTAAYSIATYVLWCARLGWVAGGRRLGCAGLHSARVLMHGG